MGALKLVTAASTDPVTLAEAKAYLRVDSSAEDTLIETLISVATQAVEKYTGRKLIQQTWDYCLDGFPHSKGDWWDGVREGKLSELIGSQKFISIPLYPLQSVTHLKTYDDESTAYTMTSTEYFVDTKSEPSRLSLTNNSVWPSTVLRPISGVEIRCVVGYTDAAAVPKPLKQAILDLLTSLYECRGESEAQFSKMALQLMSPYRVIRL